MKSKVQEAIYSSLWGRGAHLSWNDAGVAATRAMEHVPHEFVGRSDRWCEVCDRPDRWPVHTDWAKHNEERRVSYQVGWDVGHMVGVEDEQRRALNEPSKIELTPDLTIDLNLGIYIEFGGEA